VIAHERAAREITELHERWFQASRDKDLDASMEPMSRDIVSYDHSAPLQFTDIEAIREECRIGFEAADDLEWTVPDLRIEVESDLAVAWGLNRMRTHRSDGTDSVTWSRGTRVFRRVDGRGRMIHQHVSFPVDPSTGAAATGLAP
jgi:ketosteroid isomerase-like protein